MKKTKRSAGPLGLIADLSMPGVTAMMPSAIASCGLPATAMLQVAQGAMSAGERPRFMIGVNVPKPPQGSWRILGARTRSAAIICLLRGFERYHAFAGDWECQNRMMFLVEDELIADIKSLMTPNGPKLEICNAAQDSYPESSEPRELEFMVSRFEAFDLLAMQTLHKGE